VGAVPGVVVREERGRKESREKEEDEVEGG
jgi:hypothetical protein